MRRGPLALLAVLVLGTAACTSTVAGRGSTTVRPSTRAPGSSTAAPADRFARTPVSTAVGDPVTLDFCGGIALSAVQRPGYEVAFDPLQYVPGCALRLTRPGAAGHLSVLAFVTAGTPSSGPHTAGRLSGLTVYRYAYRAADGDCERDVLARGVLVKVTAVANGLTGSAALNCAGTEAVAAQLARAMAARSLPRLAVATPSLTSLDGCAIVRAALLARNALLAGATPTLDDFGIGCGLVGKMALYFDPVIEDAATPADTHAVSAGGHTLYADDGNGTTFCSFVSVQGHTSNGRLEELLAYASTSGSPTLPAGACDTTRALLVEYLDTAGLR